MQLTILDDVIYRVLSFSSSVMGLSCRNLWKDFSDTHPAILPDLLWRDVVVWFKCIGVWDETTKSTHERSDRIKRVFHLKKCETSRDGLLFSFLGNSVSRKGMNWKREEGRGHFHAPFIPLFDFSLSVLPSRLPVVNEYYFLLFEDSVSVSLAFFYSVFVFFFILFISVSLLEKNLHSKDSFFRILWEFISRSGLLPVLQSIMLWLENQSFLPFLTIILFCFFLVIHLLLILLPSSRKIQDEESIALLLHSFLWSRYYLQTRESTE